MPLLSADDTNLFARRTHLESLQSCVDKDLSTITEWHKANTLSLNVKKTCYNSAPEGRIKQDPRLFSKRLLFQEKKPVTTEIIQYKIHQ